MSPAQCHLSSASENAGATIIERPNSAQQLTALQAKGLSYASDFSMRPNKDTSGPSLDIFILTRQIHFALPQSGG